MLEIELKFQVPPERWRALEAAVAGRTAGAAQRLRAAYFDLPGRALARARLALRIRREGHRWVQTLKGLGNDGMTRLEHNVTLSRIGADWPTVDPALHAATEVGARLLAVLAAAPGESLVAQYRTDVHRRVRLLSTRASVLELALDRGQIVAGDRQLEIRELEIELKRGPRAALLEAAARWQARFGLWLDLRSKAERGDLLARGLTVAPARTAGLVRLQADMGRAEARRCVLASCADQILANASQIASGDHGPEHLHQLRVGLRRLRSGLALFDAGAEDAALADAAATEFGRLGAARDRDVLSGALGTALQAALQAGGADALLDATPAWGSNAHPVDSAVDMVRSAAAQQLWLDLLAASSAELAPLAADASAEWPLPTAPDDSLRRQLSKRLARWHRRACDDAKRYAQLGDAERHRLRKRLKRLRYGLEFAGALWPARKLVRLLRRLQAAQQVLGDLNDIALARVHLMSPGPQDPRAWFALGWLGARRDSVAEQARIELQRFAKATPSWRRHKARQHV